ncbi:MAG: type II toxin-antitoxin system death-on-curing family toxin [Clostridiales bacterium]|jgi:death-on-curing protein|nr:type II toxin-antitoxin system death-on-curing family toxin [Clostridiales bacterium]
MIKYDKDRVLLLHKLMIEMSGGTAGVRDFNLLDSALQSAFQTFDGKELYPAKEEKAARIGYALVTNHAFTDGNKRIGMYVMLAFLEAGGISIRVPNEEIVRVGLALADGTMKYDELLQWVKSAADA